MIRFLYVIVFFVFITAGTIEGNGRGLFLEEKSEEISLFINQFGGKYLTSDELNIERRSLEGTEGGEIIRYKEKSGNILRYKIKQYGETSCVEENYYFIASDCIYYTRLDEIYNAPINIGEIIDVLYKTFDEGIIIDGEICYYDKSNIIKEETGTHNPQYTELEELNNLFDCAEYQ